MGLNSHTRPRLWSQNPNPCICPLVTLCVCVSLSLSWLSRSSSYTRRFNSQSGNDLTSSTPSLLHRSVMLLTARLTLLFVCNCHCPLTANANLCAAVKGAFEFPMGSVLFPAHLMERDWMTPPWPQLAQERALLDSAALIVSWLRGIFHFTLHVRFFFYFFSFGPIWVTFHLSFYEKTSSGTDGKEGSTSHYHLQLSEHDRRRTGSQAEAQVSDKRVFEDVEGRDFVAKLAFRLM